MVEWLAAGGIVVGGIAFIVRTETRVTALERSREEDVERQTRLEVKIDKLTESVNQLIGRLS